MRSNPKEISAIQQARRSTTALERRLMRSSLATRPPGCLRSFLHYLAVEEAVPDFYHAAGMFGN